MKTRAIILAGGEGTRLDVLTAKRAKPAMTFGGKYRIIDFPLSNCVNSGIFDVMIIAQYRPQSLIEHVGAGGPWDLNRDFTGGVRIFTPYKARGSDWFIGTADAVQQNFTFLKRGMPESVLILSGDHIYAMNYQEMIKYHQDKGAELTIAAMRVPMSEASRFGIIDVDDQMRVTSFIEKPSQPISNFANMGIYLFNLDLLDRLLWEDHFRQDSSHDFGKDILPGIIKTGKNVYAYPFSDYWVDVGTIQAYWQAHMDLLLPTPPLNLHNRNWIIHTRTEERPPVKINQGARIENSMICDGCIIEDGARVINSFLSPGVYIESGAIIDHSILLTDAYIEKGSSISYGILDKRVHIGQNCIVGGGQNGQRAISLVGKNSVIPAETIIINGAQVGADVVPADFSDKEVIPEKPIFTRRLPYEI